MRAPCGNVPKRVLVAEVGALVLALVGWGMPTAHAAEEFTIAGEVDGLFPGAVATLEARVTNPHPFAIRVSAVAVTVADAAPGCPASMLEVGESAGSVVVAGGSSGIIPLDVRMHLNAPDACQGAIWPLRFTAVGLGPAATDLPGTSAIGPERVPEMVAVGLGLALAGCGLFVRDARRRGRGSL